MTVLRKSTSILLVLTIAIPALVSSCGTASKDLSSSSSGAYFQTADLPDASAYIPAPLKPDDPRFAGDKGYYEWGKAMRGRTRGKVAKDDAATSMDYMSKLFEEAIGLKISKEHTPNLHHLLSRATKTSAASNRKIKSYYNRIRP